MKRVSLFAGIASLVFGLSASAGPLQDMINAATNDTVVVPPGTYNEPIALKDGLMLISQEGPDTTIIEAPAGVAMAVAGAKDSAIVGFTIHGGQFGINNLFNSHGIVGIASPVAGSSSAAPNAADLLTVMPGRSLSATATIDF